MDKKKKKVWLAFLCLSHRDYKLEEDKNTTWGKLSSLNFAKLSNVDLVEDSYTIGRAPTNTVVVNDAR